MHNQSISTNRFWHVLGNYIYIITLFVYACVYKQMDTYVYILCAHKHQHVIMDE